PLNQSRHIPGGGIMSAGSSGLGDGCACGDCAPETAAEAITSTAATTNSFISSSTIRLDMNRLAPLFKHSQCHLVYTVRHTESLTHQHVSPTGRILSRGNCP